jgi:hypothetical protein
MEVSSQQTQTQQHTHLFSSLITLFQFLEYKSQYE